MVSPESGDSGGTDDPRVGTVLADRYRIDSLLGEGGMGKVYAAEHVLMRKKLAIKILHRELTTVPEVVARFEREAMAAANIEHPNVAAATDFGKLPEGSVFLVLEFVQGRNLRDEIAEGPMPIERALHIARQIASALGSAHDLDIVHRDLKPENVMLVKKGGDPDFVKVLDFGIARVPIGESGGGGAITKVGMVFGTPEYMAPEQALGQPVDGRADLYALGVILYEMIAGVRPFSSKSPVGILGQQLSKPVPPFVERAPGIIVPPQVEHLALTLLAKEATDRFQSAREAQEIFSALLGPIPGRGGYKFTMANGSQVAPPPPASIPDLEAPSGTEWEPPEMLSGRQSFASAPALGSAPGHGAPEPSSPFSAESAYGAPPVGSSPHAAPPSGAFPAPVITETGFGPPSTGQPSTPDQSGPHSALDAVRVSMASLPDSLTHVARSAESTLTKIYAWIDEQRQRLPPKIREPLAKVPPVAFLATAGVLVFGMLLGTVLVAGALLSSDEPVATTPSTSASAAPMASAPSIPSAVVKSPGPSKTELADARKGGETSLQELASRYPKSGAPWVELAKSRIQGGKHVEAADALAKALVADPGISQDPDVATALWTLSQTRAQDQAFDLMTGQMGEKGADIVYEIATAPKMRRATRKRAEAWLATAEFEKNSSPALNVLVDLRLAKSCRQRYALLLRAKNVGDARVLEELESYKKRDTCGGKDCYPCLRDDDRLDQAIATLEKRK